MGHFGRSDSLLAPGDNPNGANRGGYSNPEMDRLSTAVTQAIAPAGVARLITDLEKLVSSELPGIFLYYHSRAFNAVTNLKGAKIRQAPGAGCPLRDIHTWEWTS